MRRHSNNCCRLKMVFLELLCVLSVVGAGQAVPWRRSYANNMTDEEALAKARQVLANYPLTDGHNDLPWQYRDRIQNKVDSVDLSQDMNEQWGMSHTDIPRIREGQLGAQYWVAYTRCDKSDKDAARSFLEQIDVIHRFVNKYPDDFQFVRTADELEAAFAENKTASMIGVEGGQSLDSSTAALRMLYDLGVRYLGLTHNCDTPWSENNGRDSEAVPPNVGLSDYGKMMIQELNRIGMAIDLSHTSKQTQIDAMTESQAPVIFSHSNPWTMCNHVRNVQDDVLNMLQANGGVVMMTFVSGFLHCYPSNTTSADISLVADHIEYVRDFIGIDYVGLGGDFDGTTSVPPDLYDVSRYPYLFAELVKRDWPDLDLEKLAGRNIVRVIRGIEQTRDTLASVLPYDDWVPTEDIDPANTCRTLE